MYKLRGLVFAKTIFLNNEMTRKSYSSLKKRIKIKKQHHTLVPKLRRSFRLKSPKVGKTWYTTHLVTNFKQFQLANLWIDTWDLPTAPYTDGASTRRAVYLSSLNPSDRRSVNSTHPTPRYFTHWGYKHSFADTEHVAEEFKFTFAILKTILETNSAYHLTFLPYSAADSRRRSRRSSLTQWYEAPLNHPQRPLDKGRQIITYRRWSNFVNLYNEFTNYFYLKFFHYSKSLMNRKLMVTYSLFFNFRNTRLFITLQNSKCQNYFNLAVGIFLKFFKNKKSLRKNKALRFLMVKYLRKLLILSNLKNIYFHVRKTPVLFQELLNLLLQPLIKPITDPVSGRIINETPESHFDLNVLALIFSNTKSFATQKIRKKGRIKRKIRRRLFRINNVLD